MGNGRGTVAFRVNSPQVISEVIEGELVMINLERGTYYSAEGAGAAVWSLIEEGCCRDEIVAAARGIFSGDAAEIEAGIDAFLGRLEAEELIVPDGTGGRRGPRHDTGGSREKEPFVRPVLNIYTDMADILLLDPVHDVDETGWPKPKPQAP